MSTRMRLWLGMLAISLAVALGLVIPTVQASRAAGGIIYVDADATGANDGTSWADAFTALQPALEAAQTGDQIWVAAGTYTPSLESDPDDPRSASFQMKNGVAIYGGFAGGETRLEQRDWENNPPSSAVTLASQGRLRITATMSYTIHLAPPWTAAPSWTASPSPVEMPTSILSHTCTVVGCVTTTAALP